MCRKLEDCLLTRTGFRIFIFTILTLIVGAIAFNISYKFLVETSASMTRDQDSRHVSHVSGRRQRVLLWTPLHGSWSSWWSPAYLGEGGVTGQCGLNQRCSFTSDRASLDNSSLVMFSYSDLRLSDMPPKYLLGQQWALFLPRPAPRHAPDSGWARYLPIKLWRNFVDRAVPGGESVHKHFSEFSSDLTHFKYGEVRSKRHHRGNFRKRRRAFQYDSRLVATIIDDCHSDSNREGYIEAMSDHVTIHIYGSCGAPCPGASPRACLQYLARFYKFLLVFEQFMCQHYVSDLVWAVLKTNLVPVVFGGVNYAKLLPLGSYIDALNQSPKNLAHFLRYLDKNPELYNNYHQWKKESYIEEEPWQCSLCESLNSFQTKFSFPPPPSQVSPSPPADMCTSWPDLKFSVHHSGSGSDNNNGNTRS